MCFHAGCQSSFTLQYALLVRRKNELNYCEKKKQQELEATACVLASPGQAEGVQAVSPHTHTSVCHLPFYTTRLEKQIIWAGCTCCFLFLNLRCHSVLFPSAGVWCRTEMGLRCQRGDLHPLPPGGAEYDTPWTCSTTTFQGAVSSCLLSFRLSTPLTLNCCFGGYVGVLTRPQKCATCWLDFLKKTRKE